MVIRCTHCRQELMLRDDQITDAGTRVLCPKCKTIFIARRSGAGGEEEAAPSATSKPAPSPGASASAAPPPPAPGDDDEELMAGFEAAFQSAEGGDIFDDLGPAEAAAGGAAPAAPAAAPAPDPSGEGESDIFGDIFDEPAPAPAPPAPSPPPPPTVDEDEDEDDIGADLFDEPAPPAPAPPPPPPADDDPLADLGFDEPGAGGSPDDDFGLGAGPDSDDDLLGDLGFGEEPAGAPGPQAPASPGSERDESLDDLFAAEEESAASAPEYPAFTEPPIPDLPAGDQGNDDAFGEFGATADEEFGAAAPPPPPPPPPRAPSPDVESDAAWSDAVGDEPQARVTPPRRPTPAKKGFPVGLVLGLLLLLGIGGGVFAFVIAPDVGQGLLEAVNEVIPLGIETEADEARPALRVSGDEGGRIEVSGRDGFVVVGHVDNISQGPAFTVEVKGTLLDESGAVVGESRSFGGNRIDESQLTRMTNSEIRAVLDRPIGDGGNNVKLEPGQSVAFQLVFIGVPGSGDLRYELEPSSKTD